MERHADWLGLKFVRAEMARQRLDQPHDVAADDVLAVLEPAMRVKAVDDDVVFLYDE